jgi:hypothetical protein
VLVAVPYEDVDAVGGCVNGVVGVEKGVLVVELVADVVVEEDGLTGPSVVSMVTKICRVSRCVYRIVLCMRFTRTYLSCKY